MSFSIMRRAVERELRLAAKAGLPEWVASHVAERLRYAQHWRSLARQPRNAAMRDQWTDKAITVASGLQDLVAAYRLSTKDRT